MLRRAVQDVHTADQTSILQIQRRERSLDHADYTTPTRHHELHHELHHTDHTDQESIYDYLPCMANRNHQLWALRLTIPGTRYVRTNHQLSPRQLAAKQLQVYMNNEAGEGQRKPKQPGIPCLVSVFLLAYG